MIEEMKNVQKLTDEELNLVAGGTYLQNAKICSAIFANNDLYKNLTYQERDALTNFEDDLATFNPNTINTVAGILSSKLGINVTFGRGRAMTQGTMNGKTLSAEEIVNAINNFRG